MEKKVFDYVKGHPGVSHHEVAKDLDITEREAHITLDSLYQKGFLRYAHIRPLSDTCDNSLTYEARTDMRE